MTKLVAFLTVWTLLSPATQGNAQTSDPPVRGTEYAAAVNLKTQNVKVEAKLFVPDGVSRIRGGIVVIAYGLGGTSCCYYDETWRQLAKSLNFVLLNPRFSNLTEPATDVWNNARLGGADVLLRALTVLADETGHGELRDVPLLFWGHSAAGPFGASFAAIHPDRTLGSVRYHSAGAHLDVEGFRRIPALFFIGGKDSNPAWIKLQPGTKSLWNAGRANGAPWAWAVEPDAEHGSAEDVQKANALLLPWVIAVVRERLTTSGSLGEIAVERGFLADNETQAISSYHSFQGDKGDASWLPDALTAQAWRRVTSGR